MEPVRGLLVFAAARFFLEPRFCEPWAALVVNAYPILWQWFNWYRYLVVQPGAQPQPADVGLQQAKRRQCDVQCQRDFAY